MLVLGIKPWPLEEQRVLLTPEPPLHSQCTHLNNFEGVSEYFFWALAGFAYIHSYRKSFAFFCFLDLYQTVSNGFKTKP